MDLTGVANLALTHLAEPLLTDYSTDVGTTADYVRTHLTQCRDLVLEGHVWSFAKRFAALTSANIDAVSASVTIGDEVGGTAVDIEAVTSGPSGNNISINVAASTPGTDISVAVAGSAITVTPISKMILSGTTTPSVAGMILTRTIAPNFFGSSGLWDSGATYPRVTASQTGLAYWKLQYFADESEYPSSPSAVWQGSGQPYIAAWDQSWAPGVYEPAGTGNPISQELQTYLPDFIAAINASASASALITATAGSGMDPLGFVPTVSTTFLSGGEPGETVYAPAYGSAFNLPTDCARLVKIDGTDRDIPRERFEIRGRYLLLFEADATPPVIEYVTNAPPVDDWPATFVDAVAYLLASRLAPLLSKDQGLSASMLQKHEMALAKARVRDARETRSRENWTPRQLLGRSHLYRSRFGGDRALSQNPATIPVTAPETVADWSAEII